MQNAEWITQQEATALADLRRCNNKYEDSACPAATAGEDECTFPRAAPGPHLPCLACGLLQATAGHSQSAAAPAAQPLATGLPLRASAACLARRRASWLRASCELGLGLWPELRAPGGFSVSRFLVFGFRFFSNIRSPWGLASGNKAGLAGGRRT